MTDFDTPQQAAEGWLTPEGLAKIVPGGYTASTIRKWLRAGKVEGAVRLHNGKWFIPRSAVGEMLKGGGYGR